MSGWLAYSAAAEAGHDTITIAGALAGALVRQGYELRGPWPAGAAYEIVDVAVAAGLTTLTLDRPWEAATAAAAAVRIIPHYSTAADAGSAIAAGITALVAALAGLSRVVGGTRELVLHRDAESDAAGLELGTGTAPEWRIGAYDAGGLAIQRYAGGVWSDVGRWRADGTVALSVSPADLVAGLGYTPVRQSGEEAITLGWSALDAAIRAHAGDTALGALATQAWVDTALAGRQAALGYTPVRQAGETAVALGWSDEVAALIATAAGNALGVVATREWSAAAHVALATGSDGVTLGGTAGALTARLGGADVGKIWTDSLAAGVLNTSNGYFKLPNGWLVQVGTITLSSSDVGTVIFPTAFPNKCYAVCPNITENTNFAGVLFAVHTSIPSKTSFVVRCREVSTGNAAGSYPATICWLAIGY